MATNANAINYFSPAKWVVSTVAGEGTHTTISSAITSASSGDTIVIMPGTYTEDPALKAGVNLSAYGSDSSTNNAGRVNITGKCSFSSAGTVSMFGIELQTNSDNLLAVTGSSASIVNLNNCYLNCSNNTGISFTSSSGSSIINVTNCNVNLGTTGISLFAHSSSGILNILYCQCSNTGASTTANTISAGSLYIKYSLLVNPVTTSSTAIFVLYHSNIDTGAQNVTALTHGGSTISTATYSSFGSGSASAVSISTTLLMLSCSVDSSNTNAVTGAGTLLDGGITFTNSSSKINTSTITSQVTSMGSLNLNTALTVANGGSGRATLTNHGVLVGAATTAITQLAAGSAGQVLQSGGASADPAYSTATYPATAGTSGNVLTSDGTNWNSSAATNSSAIVTVTGQLTNSQIKALHGTPIQIVAAPGSGKFIRFVVGFYSFVYGGTNVFTAAASQTVAVYYSTTQSISSGLSNAQITGSTSTITTTAGTLLTTQTTSNYTNLALNFYNPIATEISGNAANDNVINWTISYIICTV